WNFSQFGSFFNFSISFVRRSISSLLGALLPAGCLALASSLLSRIRFNFGLSFDFADSNAFASFTFTRISETSFIKSAVSPKESCRFWQPRLGSTIAIIGRISRRTLVPFWMKSCRVGRAWMRGPPLGSLLFADLQRSFCRRNATAARIRLDGLTERAGRGLKSPFNDVMRVVPVLAKDVQIQRAGRGKCPP